jgi:hypothetical protein
MDIRHLRFKIMVDKGGSHINMCIACYNVLGGNAPLLSLTTGIITGEKVGESYDVINRCFAPLVKEFLSLHGKLQIDLGELEQAIRATDDYDLDPCCICAGTSPVGGFELKCCNAFVHKCCQKEWMSSAMGSSVCCGSCGDRYVWAEQMAHFDITVDSSIPDLQRIKACRFAFDEHVLKQQLHVKKTKANKNKRSKGARKSERKVVPREEMPEIPVQLLCLCQYPWDHPNSPEGDMIFCMLCENWFHQQCINMDDDTWESHTVADSPYTCTACARGDARHFLDTHEAPMESTQYGVPVWEDCKHIPRVAGVTAYSPDCFECRTSAIVPERYQRITNATVTCHMDLTGDNKCLNCMIGKMEPGCLFYCPKCNVSKRQTPPGHPHVGFATLSPEQQVIFDEHKASDAQQRSTVLKKKKEAANPSYAPIAMSYAALSVAKAKTDAVDKKERGSTHSQVEQPMLPDDFNHAEQIGCMPLHVMLGEVLRFLRILIAHADFFDAIMKLYHFETTPGFEGKVAATVGAAREAQGQSEPRHALIQCYKEEEELQEKAGAGAETLFTLKKSLEAANLELRVSEEAVKVTRSGLEAAKAAKKFTSYQTELAEKELVVIKKAANVDTLKDKVAKRVSTDTAETRLHLRIESLPGPLRRQFDLYYKEHGIQFTSFHGNSMNGNSCAQMLKTHGELIKCMHPIKVISQDMKTTKFVGSTELCNRELLRWNKFAGLATLFSADRPLCWHEHQILEGRAVDLAFYVPLAFPEELLNPKFHYAVTEMHRYANLMGTHTRHIKHTRANVTQLTSQRAHRYLSRHDKRAVHRGISRLYQQGRAELQTDASGKQTLTPAS